MTRTQPKNKSMNTENSITDGLWDDAQVANYLNTTLRTVRIWRNLRGLPHIKITKKAIRFRRADVDKWIAQRRVAHTSPYDPTP
jgi:excisionase family DNA binding protein